MQLKKSGVSLALEKEQPEIYPHFRKGCADPDTKYPLKLTDGLLPLDIHTFDKDALILETVRYGRLLYIIRINNPTSACISMHL